MGFRDTFTKEEDDEVLGYDDAAFYYFACSVLVTLACPWTYYFLTGLCRKPSVSSEVGGRSKSGASVRACKTAAMIDKAEEEEKTRSRGCDKCWWLQLVLLALIWSGGYYVMCHMSHEEVRSFDPFSILEVESGAANSAIKKAYHKLSLVWHPDKNPDDPLANARFIQITKAYQALTDTTAKANYEKYGNPDGPQTTKVGIGLPRFLLEKDNQVVILLAFFFALLVFIPALAICYYNRTKGYAGNGVLIETLQFMEYYIKESTRMKNCTELLAASAESRKMESRIEDVATMKVLNQEVTEHKKKEWPNHPLINRNNVLLLAHMQRFHDQMTGPLRADLDKLLSSSMRITQAMIEYACMRDWFFTAQSIIEFRRNLVQALDLKPSQLLQVPHFTDDVVRQCLRAKGSPTTLSGFISRPAQDRKGLSKMTDQQLEDITAFVAHVSDMDVQAKVLVEDEEEIVAGDVATVQVMMTRKNLREGECVGPVHAPFFPEEKGEDWWLFLVEPSSSNRIVAFERVRDPDRDVEVTLRFQVEKPGKRKLELHAMCDGYAGIDRKVDLSYTAFDDNQVRRDVFIHREDEDLDLVPTLFQQLMGDFGQAEESEDEDDAKAQQAAQRAGSKEPAEKSGSRGGSPSQDAASGKDDDDDDASSVSSDDSD